jgi:hypothetical protein
MEQPTTTAKIVSFIEEALEKNGATFIEHLKKGNLFEFEEVLTEVFQDAYNQAAGHYMEAAAQKLEPALRARAGRLRLGKLVKRPVRIQIRTGFYVQVEGLYAKKAPPRHKGSRHLLCLHWKTLKGASPGYFSTVCLLSVLCPSFEVAGQVLGIQRIAHNVDRVMELTRHLARHCKDKQAELSKGAGESLNGKRVIIGIDGGRSRIRQYNGKANAKGNATFDTPWVEPKMFVIDILDDKGNIDRKCLPIYGCLFGDDELVALLATHLKGLEIEQAKQVQIVADGSPWIWNRVKPMLIKLGLEAEKIVETLDYYHASEYVSKIIAGLPKKFAKQAGKLAKEFKECLWSGNIGAIIDKCEEMFKSPSEEIKRYVGYFSRNQDKMRYADYQKDNLMCGSGIIESGIRRVINLRFKNSSAFWKKDNVESLYFLRGIVLSFRWQIMMMNLMTI